MYLRREVTLHAHIIIINPRVDEVGLRDYLSQNAWNVTPVINIIFHPRGHDRYAFTSFFLMLAQRGKSYTLQPQKQKNIFESKYIFNEKKMF